MGAEGSKHLEIKAAKEFARLQKEAMLEQKRKEEEEIRRKQEEEQRLIKEEEERMRKLYEKLDNFNGLQQITWSWQYEIGNNEELEIIWQDYSDETNIILNMNQKEQKTVTIGEGNFVDLNRMCVYRSDSPNNQKQVRKTEFNQRGRRCVQRYVSDVININWQWNRQPIRAGMTEFQAQLVKYRPMEPWLSYYWQKMQKKSSQVYPTVELITQGIQIEAQKYYKNKQNKNLDKKQYIECQQFFDNIKKIWEEVFNLSGIYECSEINNQVFTNISSKLCQSICFIYSMDTFLNEVLRETTINKDYSKVDTLGPFACVLSQIIQYKDKMKDEFEIKTIIKQQKLQKIGTENEQIYFKVYRAMYQTKEEIEKYQIYVDNYANESTLIEEKYVLYFQTYCSTSYNKQTALDFAIKQDISDDQEQKQLVLFEIYVKNKHIQNNKNFIKMDFNHKYTAYPEENECLFQHGSEFKVQQILQDQKFNEIKFTQIRLDTNF